MMENKLDKIGKQREIIGYLTAVNELFELMIEGYEPEDMFSIMRGRALQKSGETHGTDGDNNGN